MTDERVGRVFTSIEHTCLRDPCPKDCDPQDSESVTPLHQAELSDRQKLSVLLQAAAVLAHLRTAGRRLGQPLEQSGVDRRGRWVLDATSEPGTDIEPAQKRLATLLESLFSGKPEGRGQARYAARQLLADWQHTLTPLAPQTAVCQVVRIAPFLARRSFGPARQALVALLRRDDEQGETEQLLSLVGPTHARRALVHDVPDDPTSAFQQVLERLASNNPDLWTSEATPSSPTTNKGRATTAAGRVQQAEAAFEQGRFEQVLAHTQRARSLRARQLRAWSQFYLRRHGAALDGVRRLRPLVSHDADKVDLLDIKSRCLAARIQRPALQEQLVEVERLARDAEREETRLRAGLVAAGIAWDLDDLDTLQRWLHRTEAARQHPEFAWRWHHTRALQAMKQGDPDRAERSIGQALRLHRRQLRGFEAAGLWNDLGMSRAQRGDLAAAERAFRHSLRLFGSTQDPRRDTLARCNLAEIRLRRGRLGGVRASLERSSAATRRSGNLRSSLYDYGLWARYELTLGRPEAALSHLRQGHDHLHRQAPDWRLPATLRILAARAHGWLGRSERAAAELAAGGEEALAELEPEERPAVLAAAGKIDTALELAREGPLTELWTQILSGEEVPETTWSAVEALEPFRAARLVFDAEMLRPDSVPPNRRRRAARWLRELGADGFASLLEQRDLGPWQALEEYWRRETRDRQQRLDSYANVLAACGHGDAELWWDGVGETPRRFVAATRPTSTTGDTTRQAARQTLQQPLRNGSWRLTLSVVDPAAKALLALAARDLEHPSSPQAQQQPPSKQIAREAGMVGKSPQLQRSLERLRMLAAGDLPLLLRGESGTGKELAARWAHRLSSRSQKNFLPLNCAALSETLVLSDLFGHARGAFTGADRERAGVFESAQGGTVFLDEIGDLPTTAQGMLLRVLQEGEIRRLGESQTRRVDVRVITATHRDLAAMVDQGEFRQDLFFRLKVAAIELPPLRRRGDDILLLASHFLAEQDPDAQLDATARDALSRYAWPGNVRELRNVMQVAAALAQDKVVTSDHLDLPQATRPSEDGDYQQRVEAYRRRLVSEALETNDGNQSAAARQLGLTRQALSYLVRQLELN